MELRTGGRMEGRGTGSEPESPRRAPATEAMPSLKSGVPADSSGADGVR